MNKYIRRHIIVEYWFIIICTAFSIGLSALYIIQPASVLTTTTSEIVAHSNTVILIALSSWLWFLRQKIKDGD